MSHKTKKKEASIYSYVMGGKKYFIEQINFGVLKNIKTVYRL